MTARTLHERFADRERRDPVLRNTVDYLHPHATQARLIGDGTIGDELDCQQAMIETIKILQSESAAAGPKHYQGDLGRSGVRVAEIIIDAMKPHNGLCDLPYAETAGAVGCCYDTAMDWVHELKELNVLDYQRRSIPTNAPKAWGVAQRIMMSSVIWLTPDRLPDRPRAIYIERRDKLREETRLRREREEAERRELARELELARDREYSRRRMTEILEARKRVAQENGTPPRRRRAVRLFDPYKVNPRGMERLHEQRAAAVAASKADEERDAGRVAANAAHLKAQMLALCA